MEIDPNLPQITNKLVARLWASASKSRLWLLCHEERMISEGKLFVKEKDEEVPDSWWVIWYKQAFPSNATFPREIVLGVGLMSLRRGGVPEFQWIWQQYLSQLQLPPSYCVTTTEILYHFQWPWETGDLKPLQTVLGNTVMYQSSNPTWNQHLKTHTWHCCGKDTICTSK